MYDKYNINSWNDVEPYYKELYSRSIDSVESLEKWIEDRSKLYALMEETYARAYINLQRYTDNKDYEKTFINFTKIYCPNTRSTTSLWIRNSTSANSERNYRRISTEFF